MYISFFHRSSIGVMKPIILEYVWIDAAGGMRSKTRVEHNMHHFSPDWMLSDHERWDWSFDGSSTGQATGTDSDVIIRPVAIFPNPSHVFL